MCKDIEILVVDDDSMNIEVLVTLLDFHFALEAHIAKNGQIAVDMVSKDFNRECCPTRYKLIFMDYDMPVLNGAEATREILTQKRTQDLFQVDYESSSNLP